MGISLVTLEDFVSVSSVAHCSVSLLAGQWNCHVYGN